MIAKPNPVEIAVSLLVVGVVVIVLVWFANWDPFGSKRRLENRAASAEAQVKSEQATTKALDHYTREITIVREKADGAVAQVQQAPGADTPIPAAILDAWARGLRHEDPPTPDAEHPR